MQQHNFLGGVVEGFYGQPWTQQQRMRLYDQMAVWRLNTYFYAPKDDLKHRAIWRELYHDAELASLRELVYACEQRGLNFIYGISPGLDIRFAEQADRKQIKARFDQLRKVGVRHFALLFDDLPGQMLDADRHAFPSLAAAQCDVANEVFAWACQHADCTRFLFCPTPYCDRMDRAQLGGAGYLEAIGQLLHASIDILWTGPEIVSREIPIDSIRRLAERIRRPPVIWDNLFANDYDLRRLYCGPYAGRDRELLAAVRGILVNPNNEFAINFIPLHTLSAFLQGEGAWQPREAFLAAATEWLAKYETDRLPIADEDLVLLADCYYLPHDEGPEAQTLYRVIDRLLRQPVDSWGDAYEKFSAMNRRIQSLFERLTELHDRELFHAWSRRAWEFKEEMQMIDSLLTQKKAGRDLTAGIALETHLPGTYRGGMVAKLERLFSMDDRGTIRPRAST